MFYKFAFKALIIVIALLPQVVLAQEVEYDGLFADWNGYKSRWANQAVSIDVVQTTDFVSNLSGGLNNSSAVLGNTDISASLDTNKAGLWNNGTFFFYVLANYGRDPSSFI